MAEEKTVYSNGILAESGDYGLILDVGELYELIRAERGAVNDKERAFLDVQTAGRQAKTLGPPPSIVPDDLVEARWGILWPPEPLSAAEQAHKDALDDLIAYRRQQMGGQAPHQFYYQPGWSYDDFLWEEGRQVEPGTMQPDIVPYYLCIVGPPERIPWEFQQYLDGEYAVGRLWFDDPADCARYVKHLLAYEKTNKPLPNTREALFVGTQHPDDPPTQTSATRLVRPLYDWLPKAPGLKFRASLLLGAQSGSEATKTHLLQRLKGRNLADEPLAPPSLLFTAGHGMEHEPPLSSAQYATQGALVFQEWPHRYATLKPDHYLAGDEVGQDMQLTGMAAFCFACFSAGTPLEEDWVYPTFLKKPARIAPAPFVARLPQKLLAHGLVAFIGHVSKAWDFSFLGTKRASEQVGTFRETIGELLRGRPIGHATDYLNERWTHLTVLLDRQVANPKKYSKEQTIATWEARNDCRGYAILGDPAARLRVERLK